MRVVRSNEIHEPEGQRDGGQPWLEPDCTGASTGASTGALESEPDCTVDRTGLQAQCSQAVKIGTV